MRRLCVPPADDRKRAMEKMENEQRSKIVSKAREREKMRLTVRGCNKQLLRRLLSQEVYC